MIGADALASAIKQTTATAGELNAGVGFIREYFSNSPVVATHYISISGILPAPFRIERPSWSSVFIGQATTLGASLVGRRVLVQFVSQQAIVAYTIGD